MPSSKKTTNLLLNKWLGSDKPKKDDFNEDNDILDQSIGALRAGLDSAQKEVEQLPRLLRMEWGDDILGASSSWGRALMEYQLDLEGQIAGAKGDLDGRLKGVQDTLGAHAADSGMHPTAQEKALWGSAAPVVRAYTGDDSLQRTISLGFTPSAGVVFAAGQVPIKSTWIAQTSEIWSAFFSSLGSSGGAKVVEGGLEVLQTGATSEGLVYRLNNGGSTYVCFAWR